jgi:hypothetical protein
MTRYCNEGQIRGDGLPVTLGLAANFKSLVRANRQSDACPVTSNVSETTNQGSDLVANRDSDQTLLSPPAAVIQPTRCDRPRCRVCLALGLYTLPGGHHPLTSARARARADEIHARLVRFQETFGHPPRSMREVFATRFASSGLLSRYLQRLEIEGRVRKVSVPGKPGRGSYTWEAVQA